MFIFNKEFYHQSYGGYCQYVQNEGYFRPIPFYLYKSIYDETINMTKKERKVWFINYTENYHKKALL